ncbi:hypothetical protein CDO73_19670 [Saccharibacillus sp. O23]|uniref:GGDEF domain-containing protein n=1 Tax=Saccharibacillus sp. O23 TaxID=2009338 RepID=UPI000B4E7227|nr:GGDEF domain-containing protein [Saccharibacillus sp. O23]OWR28104.1 hypothetical protein CDO73_19670 [Saccharibacillus sp. O23]
MANVDRLNRQVLNAYWIVAAIVFVVQIAYSLAEEGSDPDIRIGSVLVRSLLVVIVAGLGEILYASFRRYGRQVVIGISFTMAYLNYLNLGLYTENTPGILLIFPMFVPLIYFDRRLLDLFGALNIAFYAVFYFAIERTIYDRNIEDFVLRISMLACSLLLGRVVLSRAIEIGRQVEQLTKTQQDLIVDKAISQRLLKTDSLTQLYNHQTFYEYLEDLVEQCKRNGLNVQVAVLDIDNFKKINDTYGHMIGDLVLKEVSIRVGMAISPNDFAARYGGEEFAIIFTEKTPEEAAKYAERIRSGVEQANYSYMGNHPVTVSIGLSAYEPEDTAETMFGRADAALYRAKRTGKNRVVGYDADQDALSPK